MSTTTAGRRGQATRAGEPRKYGLDAVILTMAIACGLTVANLYYAQPLLALIAGTFGVSRGAAATVVTVTQLGYAAGLAFLVPLGDRLDNRRFSCWALLAVAVALAVAALSPVFPLFLLMSAIIGVTSVTVQVLVPFAARLAPAGQRGRYVGRVMSGLLLGILLARSVASVAAAAWGWRSIYLISAVAMLLLAASALRGQEGIDTIEGAHAAVTDTLGPVVGVLFAVGLLASGLASTSVGCYAGSVIMEGLLHRRVNLLLRRVITLIPALLVLAIGADPTTVLVISQVILSFGLPFVLIPLLRLTSDRTLMGADANRIGVKIIGWLITGAIVALNAVLIVGVLTGA